MSDAVLVAIIAAVPSILSLCLTAAIVFHAWHVPHTLGVLVEHTNGLTEELLHQKGIASRAEGVQAEKSRVGAGIVANTERDAAVILAAAQLAAEKILAAAELAKRA